LAMNLEPKLTIEKEKLQDWVKDKINECLEIIGTSNDNYLILDALSKYEILDYLRINAKLELIIVNRELYKKIITFRREARHFFKIEMDQEVVKLFQGSVKEN